MRIALVVHKLPPYSLGGVEIYTLRVACALARLGHQVVIFYRRTRQGEKGLSAQWEDLGNGVRGYGVSYNPQGVAASPGGQFWHTFLNRAIERCFQEFLRAFAPEIVHVQHVVDLSVRIISLARKACMPVILTLHDYWFICGNAQLIWPTGEICSGKAWGVNCVRCATAARYPSPLVERVRPLLAPLFLFRDHVVRKAALQASAFISPSRFLIERYAAHGFPLERMTYLENGIPVAQIQRFPPTPSSGKLRITYLGSIAWQKGVHILAEAFRQLPRGLATLQIWGDPSIFPGYADQIRRTLRGCEAHMMGPIESERVGEALAHSDVLVVPSLWYENSPTVIQEAWAARVPVVVSGHGALLEKVRHGVNGFHFPPGDVEALRRILEKMAIERQILSQLREGIPSPIDIENHTEALVKIYERVSG